MEGNSPIECKVETIKQIVVIEDDVVDLWHTVGASRGLTTDADVCRFLLSLYFSDGQDAPHGARCGQCNSLLTLICTKCQRSSQGPSQQGTPSQICSQQGMSSQIHTQQDTPSQIYSQLTFLPSQLLVGNVFLPASSGKELYSQQLPSVQSSSQQLPPLPFSSQLAPLVQASLSQTPSLQPSSQESPSLLPSSQRAAMLSSTQGQMPFQQAALSRMSTSESITSNARMQARLHAPFLTSKLPSNSKEDSLTQTLCEGDEDSDGCLDMEVFDGEEDLDIEMIFEQTKKDQKWEKRVEKDLASRSLQQKVQSLSEKDMQSKTAVVMLHKCDMTSSTKQSDPRGVRSSSGKGKQILSGMKRRGLVVPGSVQTADKLSTWGRMPTDSPDNNRGLTYICPNCSKEFKSQRGFSMHLKKKSCPKARQGALSETFVKDDDAVSSRQRPEQQDSSADTHMLSPDTHRDSSADTPRDSSEDTHRDSSADTPRDSSADTHRDSSADTHRDSSADTPRDSSADTHRDSSADTPRDSSADTHRDSSADTHRDSSADTPRDSSEDTHRDSSADTPRDSSEDTHRDSSADTQRDSSADTHMSSPHTHKESSVETHKGSAPEQDTSQPAEADQVLVPDVPLKAGPKGSNSWEKVKRLVCSVPGCPYATNWTHEMKFHIRKHDRFGPLLNLVEKKAKPIQQCKVPSCPFETDRSNDLKKHMARHDKYGPQWRSVLKRHMPLQHCSVPACSFSTTRSQDMRRHMRRHDKGTVPLDIPKKRDPVDSPATGNLDTSNSSAPKDLDTSNPSASGNLDTSNPSASRNLDSNELSVEVNLDPEGFRAQMKPDPTDFSAFVDPHPRDLSGQEIFDLNDFGVEVKPDPSDSSAQEKPGPSAQEKHDSSNTTSQEKPELSDTTSQQKPESSDSISQQKPESSDTTSQEKHDSSDTTSQEKHDSSDTTSQQKPESSATSSQEKPELSDSSSQEKHDPSESKAHEKCHASDSRAKYKAKRYRCNVPLCTFATNRVHEMLHHMKRNQRHGPQSGAVEKQAKPPQCCKEPTCFFATTNPNDMKRHMEWHTKRARQERSPKPFWIPHAERSYRNGCQVLHCRVGDCTYTCYTSSHNLLRHMHNRHPSFMANIEMPLKARKGPAQTTISHLCDQCGMAYKTESGLRLHKEKVHMGYSRYRCEKCDTGFVTKGHFSHHMLQHEDVTCSVCGETLPGKKELQLHMKTTHPSPTHLACEEEGCLAVFSQKSQLTRHILSKHKGRNFVCPVCGLTLTYSFTLIRHMRTCHKMTVPLQRPGVRKRR